MKIMKITNIHNMLYNGNNSTIPPIETNDLFLTIYLDFF